MVTELPSLVQGPMGDLLEWGNFWVRCLASVMVHTGYTERAGQINEKKGSRSKLAQVHIR